MSVQTRRRERQATSNDVPVRVATTRQPSPRRPLPPIVVVVGRCVVVVVVLARRRRRHRNGTANWLSPAKTTSSSCTGLWLASDDIVSSSSSSSGRCCSRTGVGQVVSASWGKIQPDTHLCRVVGAPPTRLVPLSALACRVSPSPSPSSSKSDRHRRLNPRVAGPSDLEFPEARPSTKSLLGCFPQLIEGGECWELHSVR